LTPILSAVEANGIKTQIVRRGEVPARSRKNALCHRPGKAIAAIDVSGFAGVRGAMAIIDLELRCRSKQELMYGLEFAQCRKSDRHDSRAQDVGNSALGRGEREDPIGGLNQTLREGDTLALIGVKQRIRCAAPEYGFGVYVFPSYERSRGIKKLHLARESA
jgi:hypothetical protein